jgi:hypothetical protein
MSDREENGSGSSPRRSLYAGVEAEGATTAYGTTAEASTDVLLVGDGDGDAEEDDDADPTPAEFFASALDDFRSGFEGIAAEFFSAVTTLDSNHPGWRELAAHSNLSGAVSLFLDGLLRPITGAVSTSDGVQARSDLSAFLLDGTDSVGSNNTDALVSSIAELVSSVGKLTTGTGAGPPASRAHREQRLVRGASVSTFQGASAVTKSGRAWTLYLEHFEDSVENFNFGDTGGGCFQSKLLRNKLSAAAQNQVRDEHQRRRVLDSSLPTSHRELNFVQLVATCKAAFTTDAARASQRHHFQNITVRLGELITDFIRRFEEELATVYPEEDRRPPSGDFFDIFCRAIRSRATLYEHVTYQASGDSWSRDSEDSLERAFEAARRASKTIEIQRNLTSMRPNSVGYSARRAAAINFDEEEEDFNHGDVGDIVDGADVTAVSAAGAVSGGPRLNSTGQIAAGSGKRQQDIPKDTAAADSASTAPKGIVVRGGTSYLIPGGRADRMGEHKFEKHWNKALVGQYQPACVWCKRKQIGSVKDQSDHTILGCHHFQQAARSAEGACLWCARSGHTSATHQGSRGRPVDMQYYSK